MQKADTRKYQTRFFRRYLMLTLIVILGYLCEVCVVPYLKLFGVAPNLLYVMIGIVTVAYGKLRAFWVGIVYGLLMEIMLPSVTYLNLLLYPITTLFCSFAFADKPLKTIEYERAINRTRQETPAWLRTVLCTCLNTFIYEVVQVTYIYLGGSPLNAGHFLRALGDVFYTSLLCLCLLFPLRRLILGPRVESQTLNTASLTFGKKASRAG